MDQFLQHLVNTVILGGTYALLGIGLTLIFGIMRVVNFAHGELYAFGAYTVYLVAAALGLDFFLGLVIAVIAVLADMSAAAATAVKLTVPQATTTNAAESKPADENTADVIVPPDRNAAA